MHARRPWSLDHDSTAPDTSWSDIHGDIVAAKDLLSAQERQRSTVLTGIQAEQHALREEMQTLLASVNELYKRYNLEKKSWIGSEA